MVPKYSLAAAVTFCWHVCFFYTQEVQEFTTPVRGTLQTSCLTSARSRLTSSPRAPRSATFPAVIPLFLFFSCRISFFLLHQKYFWLDPRILWLSVKEESLLSCLCTFTVHVKQFNIFLFCYFGLLKWATVGCCFRKSLVFLSSWSSTGVKALLQGISWAAVPIKPYPVFQKHEQ